MCGQQPSCYPIGYQLNSRINCPRSSPCLPCRMKSIKENEGQYRKTGARFIGQDSQPSRRLGSYSCHATLFQLFVIGTGIAFTSHFEMATEEVAPSYTLSGKCNQSRRSRR